MLELIEFRIAGLFNTRTGGGSENHTDWRGGGI